MYWHRRAKGWPFSLGRAPLGAHLISNSSEVRAFRRARFVVNMLLELIV